ncbi:MAG: VanZ family protein [Planctomycetes bacterium]|nr:VanZ family protein [Planctomycetota bacterium]
MMSAIDHPRIHKKARTAIWCGYWIALFVLMHRPLGDIGKPPFPEADKVVHFVLYFGLTWIGGWRLRANHAGHGPAKLLFWAGIYVAYGGIDEWLQSYVGRTMSLFDWFADVAGVAAASIVIVLSKKRK